MTEEQVVEAPQEEVATNSVEPNFAMGLTPFGHIGINVTDASGVTAGYLISTPEEASKIAVHMIALATMMIQTGYAMAMQEQQLANKILNEKPEIWKP